MMQLFQVAQWTQGQHQGSDVALTGVSTDTRTLKPGDLFVALKGDRFDGHAFLAQAKAKGARAALVSEPTEVFEHTVLVKDTTQALGLLAQQWAAQWQLRTVGITGNSGKTSVKEMIAALLHEDENSCLATEGNFNNHIGVPLTLLRARAENTYGVYELGANHQGEIAWTASLVAPQVGVITNVTGAHLAGFGSLEGIAQAKAELIPAVAAQQGVVVLNQEGGFFEYFQQVAEAHQVTVVRVSTEDTSAHYLAKHIQLGTHHSHFICQGPDTEVEITLGLPGKHQISNALQAIAVAREFNVSWAHIQHTLAHLSGVPGRLQLIPCGEGLIIDDTYNANPGSVAAALDFLHTQPTPHMFVFGGIGELGEATDEAHRQLGTYAAELGIDGMITVGELPMAAAEAFGEGALQCPTTDDVAPFAAPVLQQGGTVLVKGSRSTAMENVVAALLAHQQEAQ